MKIAFLHLCDLHISNQNAFNNYQIKKIVDSVCSVGHIDKVILIIAGDIAYSGRKSQYNVAKNMIKIIQQMIEGRTESTVDIVCVPGNHDIDFGDEKRTTEELEKIYKNDTYDKYVDGEIKKQDSFFRFAQQYNCFEEKDSKNRLFDQKIITVNDYRIEINLFNTAVFSLCGRTDKGLHYIDQASINKFNEYTDSDLVVTVMHHSYDWFTDILKNQLETTILTKSSLVFMGHEHEMKRISCSFDEHSSAIKQIGGELCENDDWRMSQFAVGVLDTDTLDYTVYSNKWNVDNRMYYPVDEKTYILSEKPSKDKKIPIRPEYLTKLKADTRRNISKSFEDYFVFPRIESESLPDKTSREFIDENSFITEIKDKKKVIITGVSEIGKTTLLKELFLHFSEEYCVISIDTENIKSRNYDKVVKETFEEIYGDDKYDYEKYLQLPKNKRVLIIDDVDTIKSNSFDSFILSANEMFGIMIFSTKKVIDFNIVNRLKNVFDTENSIAKYHIDLFYPDKRKELVNNIVSIENKNDESIEIEQISNSLCDALDSQKRFIQLTPSFIIDFCFYYCRNIGQASNSDSSIFSKVFEAKLTTVLSKYQYGILTTEKLYRLISKVAHHIHFNKKYPLMPYEITNIIKKYNEDNDDEVNDSLFIEILKQSKIMYLTEEGLKFTNRNHLAYFVANEVNYAYNQTGDERDLLYLLNNACFGINADILMFISYITDNTRILDLLLNITLKYTNEWEEFNIDKNVPKFMKIESVPAIDEISKDEKEILEKNKIENEKKAELELETLNLYDYAESDSEKKMNQVIRALSLLTIISKCLPSFEHNMNKEMRHSFVETIFKLPNQIFYAWADEIEKNYDVIITELRQISSTDFNDENELKSVQSEIKMTAMNLLLDIYNITSIYSIKENSFPLLSRYDRSGNSSYDIQYILMAERKRNADIFLSEIQKAYKDNDNVLTKSLLRFIARHAMVYFNELDYKKRESLSKTVFLKNEEQRSLLIKRRVEGEHKA